MQIKRTGLDPQKLKIACRELADMQINVGWFSSARYPDGTPVAGVMAVQENGSAKRNIPPRPFMLSTRVIHEAEWAQIVLKLSNRVLAGKMPADGLPTLFGQTVVGNIQQTISAGMKPALKESTLYARKHRTNPAPNNSSQVLVDTRVAFNTLTFNTEKL